MTIKRWAECIHKLAKKKGWWDKKLSALEIHALIHSEVSEATEEVRKGNPPFYYQGGIPQGEAVELVDVIKRIFDYFEKKKWNIEDVLVDKINYDAGRPYRRGNKKY